MNNNLKCAGFILGAFLLCFSGMSYSSEWFEAARRGDVAALSSQLRTNSDLLNSQNEKGYTAIVLASYNNQTDATSYLLSQNANPCLVDLKGNTALMGVIFKGHRDPAKLLINRCDINHRNNEGQTALMYASLFGREDFSKELISLGAKKDIKDNEGRDALSIAEGQWNQAMVRLLKTFRIIKNDM